LLPLVLKPESRVGLIGKGEALGRRRKLLTDSGIEAALLAPEAKPAEIIDLRVLFVAGLPKGRSADLAAQARAAGVLVNVEDRPELCDFYVPAVVRRGDLLISISTSGKSPGLAKLVRQWIERRLGSAWSERLSEASSRRQVWRGSGFSPAEVSERTAALVSEREWLP
jgi:precorrin-2 dehydrogenase/sirohydrochlorin ferrochelatase